MNSIYGIILSGGMGTRMGSHLPKQFLKLNEESILRHTVRRFKDWGLFKFIVIVVPEEYVVQTEEEIGDLLDGNDKIVIGGETRHQSTLNALKSLQTNGDIIVLHDAARPFITSKDLDEICNGTIEFGAATLAEKVNETLVNTSGATVTDIVDRSTVYSIKTPQAFHSSLLKSLLECHYSSEPTDLCSWLLQIDLKPAIKISNPFNIKITVPEDIKIANLYQNVFSFNG